MSDWHLTTPVAFIIFNRPDTTERVFAEIAKAKPRILLVVADGARANRVGEIEKCAATRAIINKVNWDCKILTNYSDTNLGCKNRVASGLDWIFEQVPEAIILEDDCLPEPSFFRFCEEMLERYRDDERIAMISGDNFQFGRTRGDASYYFSRYNHIWGWASWRRAWKGYDKEIALWPMVRNHEYLSAIIKNKKEIRYWSQIFERTFQGKIDTWDYQWMLHSWIQGRISVMPNVNLISNIGFGADATHTQGVSMYADMKTQELSFPLQHPAAILPHHAADSYTSSYIFNSNALSRTIKTLWMKYQMGVLSIQDFSVLAKQAIRKFQ